MTSLLSRYRKYARRRNRETQKSHTRLDIQGLRMVAVLTVFANHLWGAPHGGFVGVDVFFVISGFLITGNLLRDAERRGTVSFRQFYWNRVRRIVPAATVVLILTYLTALMLFLPFRSQKVGMDAIFAFFFVSNWRFAFEDTDYFTAAVNTVSPLQHYWSLSIEEQFYFVWPALIFAISLIVVKRAWSHQRRMLLAGIVMSVIVALSLGWALYETATSPTWAYFNTFARVWELGVGALLACSVGLLARIPTAVKPWLSLTGLLLIAASVVLISDGTAGFPAPWAVLPVAGAALVIAAGVGGEPRRQAFLRNPVSTYIGNISYSLYLVHWPVIILLGSVIEGGVSFSVTVLSLSFALAIASYHLVENPLRRGSWKRLSGAVHELRKQRFSIEPATRYAMVGTVTLVTVSICAYAVGPAANTVDATAALAVTDVDEVDPSAPTPAFGPFTAVLQDELAAALKATAWPPLTPSMESVISDPATAAVEVLRCGRTELLPDEMCTWGSPEAQTKVAIIGNSIAMSYAGPLREIAMSGTDIQVHLESLYGCSFINDLVITEGEDSIGDACVARKQHAVDYITANRPDVVIVTNSYGPKQIQGQDQPMTPPEWAASLEAFVAKFLPATRQVVFLTPPPGEVNPADCYGQRGSVPADCISGLGDFWRPLAEVEEALAERTGALWIDSRPWFCVGNRSCPAFAGTTPIKIDRSHITAAYGAKIAPVVNETMRDNGIF